MTKYSAYTHKWCDLSDLKVFIGNLNKTHPINYGILPPVSVSSPRVPSDNKAAECFPLSLHPVTSSASSEGDTSPSLAKQDLIQIPSYPLKTASQLATLPLDGVRTGAADKLPGSTGWPIPDSLLPRLHSAAFPEFWQGCLQRNRSFDGSIKYLGGQGNVGQVSEVIIRALHLSCLTHQTLTKNVQCVS